MQTNVPLCISDNHDFYGAHQVFPLPLKFFGTWWTGWGSPGHPVSLSFRGFVLLLLQTPKREEPPIPSPQCLWDARKDLDKGSLGSTQSCKTEACSTFSRPSDHDTLCVSQRTSEGRKRGWLPQTTAWLQSQDNASGILLLPPPPINCTILFVTFLSAKFSCEIYYSLNRYVHSWLTVRGEKHACSPDRQSLTCPVQVCQDLPPPLPPFQYMCSITE